MASGATEFIDATTAAPYIPIMWSKYVLRAREQQLLYAKLFTRKYESDATYGGSVQVNAVSHLVGRTKNMSANTAVLFETNTEATTTITIGTWGYSAYAVETATKKQSYKDQMELYGPELGYALALQVDDDMAALVDDLTTNTVGSLTSNPTLQQFLQARRLLNDANVPRKGRFSIFSPASEEAFLNLSNFTSSDFNKVAGEVDDSDDMGYIGKWFRIPVYVSTNVEGDNTAGHDNVMAHSEAMTVVMQMEPTTHTWLDINYLANKVVAEQLYGVKTMRDDHACWFKAA